MKGPVVLTVRAERAEAAVGESIPLTIEVVAESGLEVQMPSLADGRQVGAFEVLRSDTPPDIPDHGKRRWTHRFTIRTLEAGVHEIPAITAKFTDRRDVSLSNEPATENELSTEPFTIAIRSFLAGEFNPEEFRDIKDVAAVHVPWDASAWLRRVLVAVTFAVVLGLLIMWRRRRRHSTMAVPVLPPHVWGLQQLDLLASERLLERGDLSSLHEYFFRLSAIVRQYIERRFGIMAAEQTTDEFLREAKRHTVLVDPQRVLLADFLRRADMVKFAKFQPVRQESDAAMAAARRFIEDTAEQLVAGDSRPGNLKPPNHNVTNIPHAETAA